MDFTAEKKKSVDLGGNLQRHWKLAQGNSRRTCRAAPCPRARPASVIMHVAAVAAPEARPASVIHVAAVAALAHGLVRPTGNFHK